MAPSRKSRKAELIFWVEWIRNMLILASSIVLMGESKGRDWMIALAMAILLVSLLRIFINIKADFNKGKALLRLAFRKSIAEP